jgi:hypothetical protein
MIRAGSDEARIRAGKGASISTRLAGHGGIGWQIRVVVVRYDKLIQFCSRRILIL